MVNCTIDHIPVTVPANTTIMQAAESVGITIPHLCFLKDLNEIAACRVCAVEIVGTERLLTACNNVVAEGMTILTGSPKVTVDRRRTVQMILSQHDFRCATCVRSRNCSLQDLAGDLNIQDVPFKSCIERRPWNRNFPLIRDAAKCIKCMRCIQVCDKMQSLGVWDFEGTGSRSTVNVSHARNIEDAGCSLCGQCVTHCPVGALSERDDTGRFLRAVMDPDTTVAVQVAPAVRTAWAESLGLPLDAAPVGKIFDALKKMGADYVFDTAFSADLTIMEEANELVARFAAGDLAERPMFTSCCPGWVRFLKSEYPHLESRLSTAKSPMQMFGSVMKTAFAEDQNLDPNCLFSVAVMPCLAKKSEAKMSLYAGEYAGHETDCVLTTREFARLICACHINVATLEAVPADTLYQSVSGAGIIFGATGGVMEAALRTAYHTLTGRNCPGDHFADVRATGQDTGVTEATFAIGDTSLRVAAVSGLANTRRLIEALEAGRARYDFVEVMACPGGCVGGGGQPIHDGEERAFARGKNLYFLDRGAPIRHCHENPDIRALYRDHYGEPGSPAARRLLHTDHRHWAMPRGL